MEQNRAPTVLSHQPDLARPAADQLPGDHQFNRGDHDQHWPEGVRTARRARLSQEDPSLRQRTRRRQPHPRPIPPRVELRDLALP